MNPITTTELEIDMPHVTRQPDTEKDLLAIDTREVQWIEAISEQGQCLRLIEGLWMFEATLSRLKGDVCTQWVSTIPFRMLRQQ
jgi:hypothetical protein